MRSGRGRKPKPLELIKLHGNPGKRPIPTDTPQPDKLYNVPAAPIYLDEIGKEIWNYLAPKLVKIGIMTELDIYVLENCCVALSVARKASKELQESALVCATKNEDGSNKSIQRTPYLSVWREALSEFDSNGAKLGLSPSDRVRLRGLGKKEEDEFDEFLKTGKAANGR